MSVTSPKFASSTALVITLDALADSAARECTAVDNTTTLFQDALVSLEIPLVGGTPSNYQAIYLFAYGSQDGTNFGDNATGTDAALTMRAPTNLRNIGGIQTPTLGALTWKSQPISVARAFGGILPPKWGIVVQNLTGLAFGTGCTATFTGVNTQSV
jgi:hypothetical protein